MTRDPGRWLPDPIKYRHEKSTNPDLVFLERPDSVRGIFPLDYMSIRFCQRNTEWNRFLHLGGQFDEKLQLGPKTRTITFGWPPHHSNHWSHKRYFWWFLVKIVFKITLHDLKSLQTVSETHFWCVSAAVAPTTPSELRDSLISIFFEIPRSA